MNNLARTYSKSSFFLILWTLAYSGKDIRNDIIKESLAYTQASSYIITIWDAMDRYPLRWSLCDALFNAITLNFQ